MLLSETIDDHVDGHHDEDVEHIGLYQVMKAEHDMLAEKKTGTLYRSKLWSSIAPAGNIYGYVGLLADFRQHAHDLQNQLMQVATKHKQLLGGDQVSPEDRAAALLECLQKTKVLDAEGGVDSTGFLPLEPYLKARVTSLGPLVMPTAWLEKKTWIIHTCMAGIICLVQVVCPVLIFIDEWRQPSNRLSTLRRFEQEFKLSEVLCFGLTIEAKLHALMGLLLLLLVGLIIHRYVQNERWNGLKSGRLPTSRMWLILGQLTNMWCCLVTMLAVPLRFWDEGNSTAIAMDSLTLLFIFMLDDFSGVACAYIGKSDESFQRDAAWNTALLSHCPVRLEDLICNEAKTADELWCIRLSADSTLQVASREGEVPQKCTRRLGRINDEATGLIDNKSHRLCYYTSEDHSRTLPSPEHFFLDMAWSMLDYLMAVLQIVMPIVWMAMDKPCEKTPWR